MRIRLFVLAGIVLTSAATFANSSRGDEPAAEAAFARLKALAGQWEAEGREGHERLSYELIANGTALVERETAANRPEMLTVYHLDGNRLMLTHYCMAGNQPRMELRSFDPQTGALSFDFVGATNLAAPTSGHMHSVALRLADANHIVTEWTFVENGETRMTETAQYTRVR